MKTNRVYNHNIIKEVSDNLSIKQEVIKEIVECIIEEIRNNIAQGNEVMMSGLGMFTFKNYSVRKNHLAKNGKVGGLTIPCFRFARGIRQKLTVRNNDVPGLKDDACTDEG